MTIADAAKFEELSRFCPHYNGVEAEGSNCIKFNGELRKEIKKFIDAKGKQRFQPKTVGVKTQSGGGSLTHVKCFKCGVLGHHAPECTALNCYSSGKVGHLVVERKSIVVTCFNYGEQGHISTHFQKSKKIIDAKVQGKVFVPSGANASNSNNLIRGISFINGIPLDTIIDMGATHSFISVDCVKRLNLEVSSMNGHLVIDTLANGSVTTIMFFEKI
ncbi:uncharacterized protein LOC127095478 [Lathyrus oleraceus]|uniref:uncharacterized protein LOC127095478 n=1 Tax=Pisum sativum TaxID=3888 RepID=UPI0021D19A6F|nr:uncharacterized protein LOC127095478 [Pisum sativum]